MRPLRVALETQFAYGTGTGLGTYAARIAAALRERPDVELVELAKPELDIWRFDRRVVWDQFVVPALARRAKADVIHFTGGTLPLRPPHPCVLTVHDLAWLAGAMRGRAYTRWYFAGIQRAAMRRADRLAADTETARAEIAQRLGISPEKIAVTGAGVDDRWFGVARSSASQPYALCVGTVERRKDLETAVRALALMPQLRLVSAGMQTPYANDVRRVIAECGLADRVELLGYVGEAALFDLFAGAAALLLPSRYEGFGLPALEALAAGVPVVASDIAVFREVLGECALFALPGDAAAFADALVRVITDAPGTRELIERGRMRARSFTWRSVAQRLVDLYRSLV
jgi:glycosyltransferase involved in cell wall biosynthesis